MTGTRSHPHAPTTLAIESMRARERRIGRIGEASVPERVRDMLARVKGRNGRIGASALAIAAVAWARDVDAICGRPIDVTAMPPTRGWLAPRNAHVRLGIHASWRTRPLCGPSAASCPEGTFDLVLRRAPAPAAVAEDPPPVPVAIREATFGGTATVVLVPNALLDARARYEVVHVDRSGRHPARIVASFATGDATDDKPPTWSGITQHRLESLDVKDARGRLVIPMECAVNGLFVRSTTPPTDEGTPPDLLRFAIWAGDDAKPIDYATAPIAYMKGDRWRSKSGAEEISFTLEMDRDGKLVLPNGKKSARFGVRAVDVAGNQSAPSEVSVKLPP